jgi:hypothetical protein
MFICGVTAIIGGICAVQRKHYGMALAGSIAALFPGWIFGIGAIVFTAIGRGEFLTETKTENKQVAAAAKTN